MADNEIPPVTEEQRKQVLREFQAGRQRDRRARVKAREAKAAEQTPLIVYVPPWFILTNSRRMA
jgi:hypothetical protein